MFFKWIAGIVLFCVVTAAQAQDFRAVARVDVGASEIEDVRRGGVVVTLGVSQAVPWSVRLASDPPRLIADFREIDWQGVDAARLNAADRVIDLRFGTVQPGWSRLVAVLDGPYIVAQAGMVTDDNEGTAQIDIRLVPASQDAFHRAVAAQPAPTVRTPAASPDLMRTRPRQTGDRPLVVVLDPGHGGIDPGAERGGMREKDIMLTFALELEEALLRAGGFEVVLTRRDDVFVPLLERMTIARRAQADAFISLHADAIAEGQASGATVYTLSENASDAASDLLAQRMARDDLILGVDLTHQDDVVSGVLMDLARAEVAPRSSALADALVEGIGQAVGRLHKRPKLEAAFAVLKAPDVPSVLLEVGFMSDPRDLANLRNPNWRARAALGVVFALQNWAEQDAAEALRIRQ